jgi:hypothetical protein
MEGDMKYLLLAAALAAATLIEVAGSVPAAAARYCPHGGYCPPGTCTKFNGGKYACHVKNCSANNCLR